MTFFDPRESAYRLPKGLEPLGWPGYAIQTCARIDGDPPRSRHGRFVRRMGQWGIVVACEAAGRAGLKPSTRTGVYAGYGGLRPDWEETLPRLENQTEDRQRPWYRGLKDFHPFWMLNHLSNNAHAIVAAELGLGGDGATYGGVDSGRVALQSASDALALGLIDTALVFAYDSLIQPEVLVEWPTDPATAHWIPGEAAAAVILHREGAPGRDAPAPRELQLEYRVGSARALLALTSGREPHGMSRA